MLDIVFINLIMDGFGQITSEGFGYWRIPNGAVVDVDLAEMPTGQLDRGSEGWQRIEGCLERSLQWGGERRQMTVVLRNASGGTFTTHPSSYYSHGGGGPKNAWEALKMAKGRATGWSRPVEAEISLMHGK